MPIRAHASDAGRNDLSDLRLIGKALSDTSRLRILAALGGRELCVCHIVPMLGLDASTVSRHVGVLRDAGLVAVRKEGRWLHCRRAQPDAAVWGFIDSHLSDSPAVERDERALSVHCGGTGPATECC